MSAPRRGGEAIIKALLISLVVLAALPALAQVDRPSDRDNVFSSVNAALRWDDEVVFDLADGARALLFLEEALEFADGRGYPELARSDEFRLDVLVTPGVVDFAQPGLHEAEPRTFFIEVAPELFALPEVDQREALARALFVNLALSPQQFNVACGPDLGPEAIGLFEASRMTFARAFAPGGAAAAALVEDHLSDPFANTTATAFVTLAWRQENIGQNRLIGDALAACVPLREAFAPGAGTLSAMDAFFLQAQAWDGMPSDLSSQSERPGPVLTEDIFVEVFPRDAMMIVELPGAPEFVEVDTSGGALVWMISEVGETRSAARVEGFVEASSVDRRYAIVWSPSGEEGFVGIFAPARFEDECFDPCGCFGDCGFVGLPPPPVGCGASAVPRTGAWGGGLALLVLLWLRGTRRVR